VTTPPKDVRGFRGLLTIDDDGYRGPSWWSLSHIKEVLTHRGMRIVVAAWLAVNLVSILTGILNVELGWNGIPLRIGPLQIDLTAYPPLALSLACAVWLGPLWGIVPIYLANLAGSLWSGMSWPLAALFSLAGAIETAIFWGSMVTLNISPDLRRARDLVRFAAVCLVAATTSSLAVVIWNSAHGLDFGEGQKVWRGWVLGDIAQTLLVVAPLLRFAGPTVRGFIDRHFEASPNQSVTYTKTAVIAFCVFVLMGLLVFVGIGMLQGSLDIDPATRTANGQLLKPRLFEIQFFLSLLVVALIVATGAFSTALARMGERQRNLAHRESLTGCFNRRAFYELFDREADRSRRLGQGLSLVFLDVDHFKVLNDRRGHETGDRLLQQLALRVQGVVRETDLLFRWGGEEFVLILSHTAPEDAPAMAERIRAAVAERPFLGHEPGPSVHITVSLGTVGTVSYPADPDALLARADAACYEAKRRGRDRVEVALPVAGIEPATLHKM
jgi:diguanylate cyclase (GGDEF)-like protein